MPLITSSPVRWDYPRPKGSERAAAERFRSGCGAEKLVRVHGDNFSARRALRRPRPWFPSDPRLPDNGFGDAAGPRRRGFEWLLDRSDGPIPRPCYGLPGPGFEWRAE